MSCFTMGKTDYFTLNLQGSISGTVQYHTITPVLAGNTEEYGKRMTWIE